MVPAGGADDLRARDSRVAAHAVRLLVAVEALEEARIEPLDLRQDGKRARGRGAAQPSGDLDLEPCACFESEQRHLDDVPAIGGRQAVHCEGQDIRAERVTDQDELDVAPRRTARADDRRKIGRDALRRLRAPKVAQAVDTHDGHTAVCQGLADRLVEIAPAAVARVDDRPQVPGRWRRNLDEGHVGKGRRDRAGRRGAGEHRRDQGRELRGDVGVARGLDPPDAG